jgi:hypothetical protein
VFIASGGFFMPEHGPLSNSTNRASRAVAKLYLEATASFVYARLTSHPGTKKPAPAETGTGSMFQRNGRTDY